MTGKIKKNIWLKAGMILLAAAILFAVCGRVFFAIRIFDSIKFSLFLLVFALPGVALVKLLKIGKTPLLSLVFAFALSFGVLFLLYMLFSLLKLTSVLFLIPALMLLLGIAGIYFGRKTAFTYERDSGELTITLILCAVAAGLVLLSLTASNLDPSINGMRQYHVDLLNSVGLVDSAVRGFPFQDVKAAGIPYVYHTLSFSFLAVMKSVTGFSNFDLITKFSLVVFTPFCVAVLAALTKKLTKKNIYVVLMFLFLFLLRPFENSFLYYMYGDTLGFSLSIALSAVSLLLFIDGSERYKALFSRQFVLTIVVLLLATAAKGPIAAVYLVGIGFSLLLQLIKGRKAPVVLLRGGTMLASFLLFYFLIYSSDAASLVQWYPGRFIRDSEMYSIISARVGESAVGISIAAMTIVTYCFLVLGFILLLLVIIRRFKQNTPFAEFTVGTVLAGMMLMHLTHQYGGSEIYFGLAGYPFAVVGILYAFRVLTERAKKKWIPALLIAAGSLACVVWSIKPAVNFFSEKIFDADYYSAISPHNFDEYKEMAMEDKRFDSITLPEYEAMLWLKENTETDAVIVADRILLHNKYMYGSAFSERIFYLEGYVYITSYDEASFYYNEISHRIEMLEKLYDGDRDAFTEIKDFGADYLLVSKWQHPDLRLVETVVFENEHIIVYQM